MQTDDGNFRIPDTPNLKPFKDIIKDRLQSEEKAFRRVMTRYLSLKNTTASPDKAKAKKQAEEYHFELLNFQHTLQKHAQIQRNSEAYLEKATRETLELQQQLIDANEQISQLQVQLDLAREERKRKIAYDKVARDVLAVASTQDTLRRINAADLEIKRLQNLQLKQSEFLDFRREKFAELVQSMEALGAQFQERRIDDVLIVGQSMQEDFDDVTASKDEGVTEMGAATGEDGEGEGGAEVSRANPIQQDSLDENKDGDDSEHVAPSADNSMDTL